jgi:restriction system protein
MAIPTYNQLLRPLLQLANEHDITRITATEAMIKEFNLLPDEAEKKIPSGRSTYIRNRTGWAMTFLTKGGLIAKIAPKTYRCTEGGRRFLESHPQTITVADLEAIPGWEEAWTTRAKKREAAAAVAGRDESTPLDPTETPHERIGREVVALDADLRDRLLSAIVEQSPEFFEQLVLDVLLAMGYGGSKEDAAQHLGKAGDEGIDGRINQDALGLDQILVQAKRYARDHVVTRQQIQAFIGSLAGQGVSKGVFITTSYFAGTAQEFVQRGSPTKVILVDGEQLIDIMLRKNIGVRVVETHEIKEIDQNYFDESE